MATNLDLCVTIVMSFISISHISADLPCILPSRSSGNCVPLEQCEYMLKLINSKFHAFIEYARQSQCGVKGRQVYVCCPESRPIENDGRTLPDFQECGKVFNGRIVGGNETKLGEHPWAALIIYENDQSQKSNLCGGSLINSRYVLTAAHCLRRQYWTPIQVRLGEWDTTTNPDHEIDIFGQVRRAPPHIDIDIEKIICYQNYRIRDKNQANDIGLIRLARPVTFTDFVQPICLPIADTLRDRNIEGERMEVCRWTVTETRSSSKRKTKASVPVVDFADCYATYDTVGINLRTSQLCAGGEAGIDSCDGDSGGPLIGFTYSFRRHQYAYLAGIVSLGPILCGSPGWPGVYTRVSSYIDWIGESLEP